MLRIGKLSFLLLSMLSVLMAPLSGTASAYTIKHRQDDRQLLNQTHHQSHAQHHAMNVATPCKTPGCCHDGAKAHDNGAMVPGNCNDCEAACQNSCVSPSAVLGAISDKLMALASLIRTPANHASVLKYKPEASNPPPRA